MYLLNTSYEVDLSGAWTFTPEGGEPATIQVPGGGWLKQGFTCEAGTYQRRITIPDTGRPQAVRLELGAVNHWAEYFIAQAESDEEDERRRTKDASRAYTESAPSVIECP